MTTPVQVIGWECRATAPWRITHVSVFAPVGGVTVRVRITGQTMLFDWITIAAGQSFDLDLDVSLRPGEALRLENPDQTPVDCYWSVTSLEPDAELDAAERAAGVSFAERLYPLEQPAVQQALEDLFEDWSTVGSLQETEEARLRREERQRQLAEVPRLGAALHERFRLAALANADPGLATALLRRDRQPAAPEPPPEPPQPRPTRKVRLK